MGKTVLLLDLYELNKQISFRLFYLSRLFKRSIDIRCDKAHPVILQKQFVTFCCYCGCTQCISFRCYHNARDL